MVILRNVKKHFPIRKGVLNREVGAVQAVDGVTLSVRKGEVMGIVGESGCGKSTLSRLMMRLIEPDAGEMIFDGDPVGTPDGLTASELRRQMQMVFQDSFSSLNPRMPIEDSIAFGPRMNGMGWGAAAARARDLLDQVGLSAAMFARRYPHELSGGQRQRVNIARALAMDPRVVILDEAVSALDKSVEAQVLKLLIALQESLNLTYIFVSHDLNVVRFISDRAAVMYLGRIVETGPVDAIWTNARHPYTRALLASVPSLDPDRRTAAVPISGDPPNPIDPPSGCRFRTRCPFAENLCTERAPEVSSVGGDNGHQVACHMEDLRSGHSRAGERPAMIPKGVPA